MAYNNHGDRKPSSTIYGKFHTRDENGAPITLTASPALAAYKDGSSTPITAGISLTEDWNAFTGTHSYEIDLSASASYTPAVGGSDFSLVLTQGEVDGVDQSGYEVAEFSVGKLATLAEIEEVVSIETGGLGQVTADRVAKERTFYVGSEGTVSRNIVHLIAWDTGTITLAFDLSELLKQADTTISTVSSVTVELGASITTSNLRKHQNQLIALWDVDPIDEDAAGSYAVIVTVATLDSNTYVVRGTLEVE